MDYPRNLAATIAVNILNSTHQKIRFGLGYSHEFVQYLPGAFTTGNNNFSRSNNQVYARLKGRDSFFKSKIILGYDFFFQPLINNFSDYRWSLFSSIDFVINKHFSVKTSAVSSYEDFVATGVQKNNFRLTYGFNFSF